MTDWISVKDYIPTIGKATKDQCNAELTRLHGYKCRIVTTHKEPKGRKQRISRGRESSRIASSSYGMAAKEPWILATNLKDIKYKATFIVDIYAKRMQIEESFRAMKSHQFGLAARYIRTDNIDRWGVLMLLAAVVLISY
ncbi:MAG TPA: transposase [Rickettsia endosymbiont of Pyrocoelia pectoralis]|nr:transposase [Rickettsia endosymbiont of Pyrocoelia pectoralis]